MSPHPLIAEFVEARHARKLTQRKAALLAGVRQTTLSRLETGSRDPHLPTLDTLATFYGAKIALVWPGKQCSVCGEEAPPRFFAVDLRYPDGRAPYCLACKAEGVVPASQAGCGMANALRAEARDERFQQYANYRATVPTAKQAAVWLRMKTGLGARTAMRYEQRYQTQRRQEAA